LIYSFVRMTVTRLWTMQWIIKSNQTDFIYVAVDKMTITYK